VHGDAKQQGPLPVVRMMVVAVVVMAVVSMVVHERISIQAERHGLDEGMEAETDEGDEPEPVAMNMSMLHSLAEVLQPDLEQEPDDDPLTRAAVHGECFWQQVQEAQPQKKSTTKGQNQRHLFLKSFSKPLSE
jgi:hypothetical protein